MKVQGKLQDMDYGGDIDETNAINEINMLETEENNKKKKKKNIKQGAMRQRYNHPQIIIMREYYLV